MKMTLEECLAHIPMRLTPEMEQYATDVVFKTSRYVFVSRRGKQQWGYCTHCGLEFTTSSSAMSHRDGLKHNGHVICPGCKSECQVKASGIKRASMVDEGYFVYYLKSAVDPNVVVAIGTFAVRDYCGDYRNVRTQYVDKDLYVFRPGIGGFMFHQDAWYSTYNGERLIRAYGHHPTGAVRCQYERGHNANIHTTYSRDSLAAAVANTPFQYSTWEQYKIYDMTQFMDLYARYPSVEYLTKLGFGDLVKEKVFGNRTYGLVNWRGKNPLKVLRLTKQELKEVIGRKLTEDYDTLMIFQAGKSDGSRFTLAESMTLSDSYPVDDLLALRKHGRLRKITNYLAKQAEQVVCAHARNPYRSPRAAFIAWRDYIHDCANLELDLTEERVVFPKSLHFSHQNTIARRQEIDDRLRAAERARWAAQNAEWAARNVPRERLQEEDRDKQDEAIRKHAEKLVILQFEHASLLIRPIATRDELVAEGKALHHCVANYTQQYASSKTILLAVRRVSNPETPFYTVEVFNGFVTQCYGMQNCRATDEVQIFIDAFKAAKLKTAKSEQEVAN